MRIQKKHELELKRRWRIRKKIIGTAARPRMSVRFTGLNIYVQFIDDGPGVTLASASTRQEGLPADSKPRANIKTATLLGKVAAEAALARGITAVVFDRSGAQYHGKVKALADAARAAGLKF
jgi:large subunit ribosomal protein L18